MSKIKKFRKNNYWDDDKDALIERRDPKKTKFNNALRTRDTSYFTDEDYD
jgi:hypothetical protein